MYTYNYPHPAVTADCLIFARTDGGMKLLLIRRKNEPCKRKWTFPGDFMGVDGTTVDAVRRELKEETGLVVGELHRVGISGAVDRDPRERIATVVYYMTLDRLAEASSLDDAAQAKQFLLTKPPDLAFSHKEIFQETEKVLGDG